MKITWVMLLLVITLFPTVLFGNPTTKENNALEEELAFNAEILFPSFYPWR